MPAGKLDVEGESRLECAKRELTEEVGLEAEEWSEWKRFFTSPGFAEEEVTIFEATGLSEVEDFEPDPGGADRDREVAARRPGRSDRGMPRLEVAHRPPHAARNPRVRVPRLSRPTPALSPRVDPVTFAHERVQGEGRGAARRNVPPWPLQSSPRETRKVEARFEALVLDFLAYLEFERGLARNTLDAYRTDLASARASTWPTGGRARPRWSARTSPSSWPTWRWGAPRTAMTRGGRPARRRRSAARRRACARSTATFAARS